MAKYDWKIEPRDEDWSDDTYAYFLIHINIKRMAEYLNKEFKKEWWFKADFGNDSVWIVAEHNDYPVRLFFNFDEDGWANIKRHYTDGASYKDESLGNWHYAKYDVDYSFGMIKENIKEYFNRFEESDEDLEEKPITEAKSIWYIAFYGDSGDGYVGYDNEPTNDFDNAMQFDSKKEAEKEMKILQKEWGSDLKVEEFSLEESKEFARNSIKESKYKVSDFKNTSNKEVSISYVDEDDNPLWVGSPDELEDCDYSDYDVEEVGEEGNTLYLSIEESKEFARNSIKESADDNWYKLKMLNEMLDAMAKDEYNIPKVGIYGVTKNIDLDEGAIKALIKYYK